jgi:AcrR family transcriptional regulator
MTVAQGGRRAEAARNDVRVVATAREVLIADPGAPMAELARRAGVGVGSLYRRYPSRELLVQQVCIEAMGRIEAEAQRALARVDSAPWSAFVGFLEGCLDAGAGSLRRLAGTFEPTAEVLAAAQSMRVAVQEVLERSQAAGAVRDDVTTADVNLLFEQLRAVRIGSPQRVAVLQRRYLALALQALAAPAAAPLPGPPPTWEEIRSRWVRGT